MQTKLDPETVPGSDPGSVYTTVTRTSEGYTAIRRLSKYCYRIRAERFDKAPLMTLNDQKLIAELTASGINIVDNGTRLQMFCFDINEALANLGLFTQILLMKEAHLVLALPQGTDAGGLAMDAKLDAANARAALADVSATEAVTIPKEPVKN